ncbi:unnamed protein product [Pseudo-nitzschia multistriata]|uniref:Fe2OG dioxygenase domain-containing protein n=1 Tax=Pseudo-nitzschia multistriata TaxID=183589 RepID=A0A448ZME3_9STRA|nr:unnamed protein product [Pseudo-nitzschia multistriata]
MQGQQNDGSGSSESIAATTNGERNSGDSSGKAFRSVLPHEPLPAGSSCDDQRGYVHLQGAFEPKRKASPNTQQSEPSPYWKSSEALEEAILLALRDHYKRLQLPFPVLSVRVSDGKNLSRLRLEYNCPYEALQIQYAFRDQRISPQTILAPIVNSRGDCVTSKSDGCALFGSRPCQATMITTTPLPKDTSSFWPRSNPPQFRRLLHNRGDDEQERSQTRFVYVTGLIDNNNDSEVTTGRTLSDWWGKPYAVYRALRQVFGTDIEIFLPKKQNRKQQLIQSCHLGLRSASDAQRIVREYQGRVVAWNDGTKKTSDQQQSNEGEIHSGQLFLDYATITQKSKAKEKGEYEKGKGDASRPECTSTTSHVHVPGLVVVENFLTEPEEKILLAILTGPQAPWAPQQTNKSQTGAVKRLVQHYGYVFDYQTADVLRRDENTPFSANCPPMPAIETTAENNDPISMDDLIRQGRGWEVLAQIVEKTRRHEFETEPPSSDEEKSDGPNSQESMTRKMTFPHLNQMTVNQYKPGEGIGSHIDTPSAFGDGLISISLNSGIVMEFTKVGAKTEGEARVKKLVYLPRRSLVLMAGPARYEWEHQIVTRRTDTHDGTTSPRGLRVSLTLRTALSLDGSPLDFFESSVFPPVWGGSDDGKRGPPGSNGNALVTPSTERNHVHAVYDAIATQWHHTRGKRGVLWPSATQFVQNLPEGSIVADVGCGDGKYFPAIWEAGSYVIGTDISLPLLESSFDESSGSTVPGTRTVSGYRQSLQKRPAVAVADAMTVPLRSDSCDAAICIAVMHHLSTTDRRLRCLEELERIVGKGGRIHVQAWAMEQASNSKRRFAAPDVFVPFNAQPKYLDRVSGGAGGPEPESHGSGGNDSVAPHGPSKSVAELYSEAYEKADFDERKGLVVFQRYCHMYREGELEDLVRRVPGLRLVESGYESGNHYVILEVVAK